MAVHTNPATPPQQPSLREMVREMRERNAERRERVLRNIAKLHEIAAAQRDRDQR
jgi:hypothetical protein